VASVIGFLKGKNAIMIARLAKQITSGKIDSPWGGPTY
jgi:hypothetical protein